VKRLLRALWIYAFPLVAPWVILFGVNAMPPAVPLLRASIPHERWERDRCTWDCHNRGCRHRPKLPAVITGDRGVFGATIHGLYALGTLFSSNRFVGYGVANLVVFCLAWPAFMYWLWVRAWTQAETLRALRARRASKTLPAPKEG
jgi:hypothetical protein